MPPFPTLASLIEAHQRPRTLPRLPRVLQMLHGGIHPGCVYEVLSPPGGGSHMLTREIVRLYTLGGKRVLVLETTAKWYAAAGESIDTVAANTLLRVVACFEHLAVDTSTDYDLIVIDGFLELLEPTRIRQYIAFCEVLEWGAQVRDQIHRKNQERIMLGGDTLPPPKYTTTNKDDPTPRFYTLSVQPVAKLASKLCAVRGCAVVFSGTMPLMTEQVVHKREGGSVNASKRRVFRPPVGAPWWSQYVANRLVVTKDWVHDQCGLRVEVQAVQLAAAASGFATVGLAMHLVGAVDAAERGAWREVLLSSFLTDEDRLALLEDEASEDAASQRVQTQEDEAAVLQPDGVLSPHTRLKRGLSEDVLDHVSKRAEIGGLHGDLHGGASDAGSAHDSVAGSAHDSVAGRAGTTHDSTSAGGSFSGAHSLPTDLPFTRGPRDSHHDPHSLPHDPHSPQNDSHNTSPLPAHSHSSTSLTTPDAGAQASTFPPRCGDYESQDFDRAEDYEGDAILTQLSKEGCDVADVA